MNTPFRYQATEFDCVPTTFINAIQYLFDRSEIPPVVLQKIMLYSLDTVNKRGEHGKQGTLEWLGDKNRKGANLRIKRERLDSYEYLKYSMAHVDWRECCLLERG